MSILNWLAGLHYGDQSVKHRFDYLLEYLQNRYPPKHRLQTLPRASCLLSWSALHCVLDDSGEFLPGRTLNSAQQLLSQPSCCKLIAILVLMQFTRSFFFSLSYSRSFGRDCSHSAIDWMERLLVTMNQRFEGSVEVSFRWCCDFPKSTDRLWLGRLFRQFSRKDE